MSTAGEFPADQAGKISESRHNYGLYQDPVDYAYLEEHLDELDLSPTYYETMEEKHLRQGAEFARLREFERNLDEQLQGLSDQERVLLFLKEEGKHDKEQRRMYLVLLSYERQRKEDRGNVKHDAAS